MFSHLISRINQRVIGSTAISNPSHQNRSIIHREAVLALVNRVPLPFHRMPVTARSPDGGRTDRFIALWFWKYGVFGAAEIGLLGRFCREGMSVLDIGANVGFHTLLFARAVGAGGHVWAFEPDPENFTVLLRNLEMNPYRNVTAVPSAVGAATGKASLYRSPFHCDHRVYRTKEGQPSVPVDMVSVDGSWPRAWSIS
jgi:FkbM family methyltransferase